MDRASVNQAWFEPIEQKRVEVMTVGRSDHLSLFLSFSKQRQNIMRNRPVLWFEASWITEVEGEQIVKDAWQPDSLELSDD